MEAAVALKVVKLARKVPGLHAVVTCCKAGPACLQPDGQLLEFVLEVMEVCLLAAVLYHFSICCLVR